MKRLRTILIFLIVLIAGFVAVTRWLPAMLKEQKVTRLPPGVKPEGAAVSEENIPIPVRTFKAARIEFTDLLPTLGTVRGQTEVELKFEVSGTVQAINFREGDLAKKGQELASVDNREAQLKVEYAESKQATAQAQLKLARKRLSVNEELFQIGAIIRPKLEESQIEVEQAETQVKTAVKEAGISKHDLGRTTLKAPIEGVIGTRQVEPGEYVTPQNVIATLMDVNSVYVELGIIERDIERIRLGQRVKVSVDSLPNTSFEGKVDNLAPVIEGKSRTLTAKVKVENAQGQLLPGMFARAEIAVFEKPNALVVPTSALKDADGDGKFESVFVAAPGDKAALKPITLGYLTTDYAEVSQGLDEGEQVITEARGNLKDGSALTFLEQEEAAFERAEPEVKGPEPER